MNKVESVTDDDQRQLISQLSFLKGKRIYKEIINVKISNTAKTIVKISKRITEFSDNNMSQILVFRYLNRPWKSNYLKMQQYQATINCLTDKSQLTLRKFLTFSGS